MNGVLISDYSSQNMLAEQKKLSSDGGRSLDRKGISSKREELEETEISDESI